MEDKIRQMLEESVNTIFLKLMEDGEEIGFDAQYDIDRLTEKLAGVMAGAIEELKNRD